MAVALTAAQSALSPRRRSGARRRAVESRRTGRGYGARDKPGLDVMNARPAGGSSVIDLTSREERGAKTGASPSGEGMAVDIGISPGPERTRALLEEIAGGRRGAQLRGQVAAVKRGATREQIEEAFQEACLKAGRSCRGQSMGEVYKWLLKTTDSIVDDMRDRLKREVLVDHSAKEFQAVDPSLLPPDELLIKCEERAELDELTLAILERLGERERKVAVLHSHGFARTDIARHLRITPRIVKRDVEGILATGRDQAADERAGLWRTTPALLQQVGDLPVLAVDEDVEIVQRRRRDRQPAFGEVVRKPLPERALHHVIEHLDGCADVQEQQLLADLAEPVLLVVSQRVDGAQRAGLVRGH